MWQFLTRMYSTAQQISCAAWPFSLVALFYGFCELVWFGSKCLKIWSGSNGAGRGSISTGDRAEAAVAIASLGGVTVADLVRSDPVHFRGTEQQ